MTDKPDSSKSKSSTSDARTAYILGYVGLFILFIISMALDDYGAGASVIGAAWFVRNWPSDDDPKRKP